MIVILILAAAYGFTCINKQLSSGNDFPIYYSASKMMLSGQSPYAVDSGLHGYVYLPFFGLLISPLSFLPLNAAVIVWYIINLLLMGTDIWMMKNILGFFSHAGSASFPLIIALMITAQFFLLNLDLGQANLVILTCSLFAVYLFSKGSGEFFPGFLLGTISLIKPFFLIFFLPLLIRGRWRAFLGGTSAVLLLGLILPGVMVGPHLTIGMMENWHQKIIVPQRSGELQGSKVWDQSPAAGLRRLVVDSPAFSDKKVNLASLSHKEYKRLSMVFQVVLFSLFVFPILVGRHKKTVESLFLDFALCYCAVVLLFGFNLKAQFVVLLFPLALLMLLWKNTLRRKESLGTVTKYLLIIAGILIFTPNPGILGRTVSNWMLAYSSITVGTLIIFGVLIFMRIQFSSGISCVQIKDKKSGCRSF